MERRLNRRKFVDPEAQALWLREELAKNGKSAKLERVFGTTACASSITVDPNTGIVAYPAGSTIVLLNPRTQSQAHLISLSKNQLTCLAFSPDSRYIVSGEFGADPMIRVWEMDSTRQSNGKQLAELKYHKLGITCISFIKNSNYLISVGNQHDKSIVVWNWKTKLKLAENRLTNQVNAMDVNQSGMIVTAGSQHVKFWYLDSKDEPTVLHGRSAILGMHRNKTFVGVCCVDDNRTFAITAASRLIVEFENKNRKLVGVFSASDEVPYSICATPEGNFFVGFGKGTIRLINSVSKQMELIVEKPHPIRLDVNRTYDAEDPDVSTKYPDVHCVFFHPKTQTLTAFYSDRSIYHWHINSMPPSVQKISSQLFHVGCIFDLEVPRFPDLACWFSTFFTSGSDETIRVWNMNGKNNQEEGGIFSASNSFSNELRKVVYIGQNDDSLTEQPDKSFGGIPSDTLDSTRGIRCLRIGLNNRHLACGGRNGNIYVLDLTTADGKKVTEIDAHDSEVICLEYSRTDDGNISLLASGSRDRLIHLFNAHQNYAYLTTIRDHSSSISSIKFLPGFIPGRFEMLTFGTDKLLVIREVYVADDGPAQTNRVGQIVSQFGPNCIDNATDGMILMGCQDRHIRIYSRESYDLENSESFKPGRTIKGSQCEEGTLTKVCIDPSETYAATVCSDRYVYIVDLTKGECVAALSGQSDSVTSIQFSPDCRRLIISSYSGCVFVWRLAASLTKKMVSRLSKVCTEAAYQNILRSMSPDSVIESGSDTTSMSTAAVIIPRASLRANERDRPKQHEIESQFGSLTSINIAAGALDDDLDSGIDGGKLNNRFHTAPKADVLRHADTSSFQLQRLNEHQRDPNSLSSPVRHQLQSSSDADALDENLALVNQRAASNFNLQNLKQEQTPPGDQMRFRKNGADQQQQRFGPNNAFGPSSSRSMSNINQAQASQNAPPIPNKPLQYGQRRGWDFPKGGVQQQSAAAAILPPQLPSPDYDPSYVPNSYAPHQQRNNQYPSPQQNPSSWYPSGGGMGSSISLGSLKAAQQQQQQNTTPSSHDHRVQQLTKVPTNYKQMAVPYHQQQPTVMAASFHAAVSSPFEDVNRDDGLSHTPNSRQWERESFSKRYLNQQKNDQSSLVWTPNAKEAPKRRRSSNLFEKLMDESNETAPSPTNKNSSWSYGPGSNLYIRSRSQSPSQLAIQLLKEGGSPYSNESPHYSQVMLPPSKASQWNDSPADDSNSKFNNGYRRRETTLSNSRPTSSMRNSSVTDHSKTKLNEARERLRKSKENLNMIDRNDLLDVSAGTNNSLMLRSNSIGNLKYNAVTSADRFNAAPALLDNSHNITFSGFNDETYSKQFGHEKLALNDQKRYMAKSVNSLNKIGGGQKTVNLNFQHPDECTLQNQYANVGLARLSASRQRLEQSLKDFKKISITDLTNDSPDSGVKSSNVMTEDGLTDAGNSVDAYSNKASQQYYSTTLGKNLRRGVQKKLDRHCSPRYRHSKIDVKRDGSEQTTTSGESDSNSPSETGVGHKRFGAKPKITPEFARKNIDLPARSISSFGASPAANRAPLFGGKKQSIITSDSSFSSNSPGSNYYRSSTMKTTPTKNSSTTAELASATNKIATVIQNSTDDSKKVARHASECIKEMTLACDKLIHAQQLISNEKSIPEADKRQLIAGMNEAIGAFRQRLDHVLAPSATSELL